jgi:hypothetical protein
MSQRANLIKCRGLQTSGSELSASEGSLRQATNINVDENGVITPRRGFAEYGNATDEVTAARVKQVFEYKTRLFRHFNDKLEYEDSLGQFQPISGSFNELRDGYRLKFQESKGNMYFTTDEGIKRISLRNPPNGNVNIEQAGVPKAAYMEGTIVPEIGGFLAPQTKVAYRFIFGRKDANNNLLLGSASARYVVINDDEREVEPEIKTLKVLDDTDFTNSKYIVIPTKTTKYTFFFQKTGTVNPPLNTNTFGSIFVKVDITTATSEADIAAILANEIISNVTEYTVTLDNDEVELTSTEEGNIDAIITDIAGSSLGVTEVDGSVDEGDQANTSLSLIVPSTITTDYFVQVYRTAPISAVFGLTLDDIDPGDECNLVFETAVTSDHILAGEIVVKDTTPESFRASGTPLYQNEITGEGILQANDPPPIALDIALFRNSMFYGNTKGTHRLEFNIISVDDYEANKTRFIVGNSSTTRIYTASTTEALNPEGADFALSTSPSVGISIDETSRSLVKMINKDPDSPVNAFYLTGAEDLPGQILLEARSLIDDTFYIAIESGYDIYDDVNQPYTKGDRVSYLGKDYICIDDTTTEDPTDSDFWEQFNLAEEFNPEIDVSRAMQRLYGYTVGLENFAAIELDNHGFLTGEIIYVSFLSDGDVNAPSSFSGVFTVTVVDPDNFYINYPLLSTVDSGGVNNFLVDNSAVFFADTPSDNLKVPNRLYFSKVSEPEAVPISNYIDVGAQDQEIKRILALRDNLFVLKDDGIFIVSGSSAPDFSVRLLDNVRILAPDSAVVLNNQIYALTEQGVTMITDSGAGIISSGIDNLIDAVINSKYNWQRNTFGIGYENDRAYLLFTPSASTDTSGTQAFRYNIFERTWSRWEYPATCGVVAQRDTKLYLGNGDRNYITQERKDFNYNDHADRDFVINISSNGVNNTEIKVSNTDNLQIGDVITQEQDVTINYLNSRILARIDTFDNGLVPPVGETFVSAFSAIPGSNMRDKLQALNDYLETVDPVFTQKTFTFTNIKVQMELLIDELNSANAPTLLKDYKKPETITYESYIVKLDLPNNIVFIKTMRPLLEQEIRIYKNIKKVVEWNPQHFGDPSAIKQIREATIMFDQNNFNEAFAKFASDVEQALTTVPFSGKGKGYWGDLPWGHPNHYWGGDGNDIPFRTLVPRGKQKCRYLTMVFEHVNAREYFRILGVSGVVRAISSRGYR